MALCNDPTADATSAPDLRALCLRKRAERAAPILLKAVLRAVRTVPSNSTPLPPSARACTPSTDVCVSP